MTQEKINGFQMLKNRSRIWSLNFIPAEEYSSPELNSRTFRAPEKAVVPCVFVCAFFCGLVECEVALMLLSFCAKANRKSPNILRNVAYLGPPRVRTIMIFHVEKKIPGTLGKGPENVMLVPVSFVYNSRYIFLYFGISSQLSTAGGTQSVMSVRGRRCLVLSFLCYSMPAYTFFFHSHRHPDEVFHEDGTPLPST